MPLPLFPSFPTSLPHQFQDTGTGLSVNCKVNANSEFPAEVGSTCAAAPWQLPGRNTMKWTPVSSGAHLVATLQQPVACTRFQPRNTSERCRSVLVSHGEGNVHWKHCSHIRTHGFVFCTLHSLSCCIQYPSHRISVAN
jgi:hypothetical protein